MEAFLKNLAEALNLPEAGLQAGQKLSDLPNWDSLAILTTLSMLDMEYGVTLNGAEVQRCETPADLYARVRQVNPEA